MVWAAHAASVRPSIAKCRIANVLARGTLEVKDNCSVVARNRDIHVGATTSMSNLVVAFDDIDAWVRIVDAPKREMRFIEINDGRGKLM